MSEQSIEERMMEIARVALETTRDGQTSWRETDDPDAFLTTFTQTSLIVDHFSADEFFKLSLLTAQGTHVEELVAARPRRGANSDPWAEPTPAEQAYNLLKDLHDAARRSALNIDALLDSAIADLRHGPVEEPPF